METNLWKKDYVSDRRINEANVKETNFSSQTLLNNSPKIKGGQIDASINSPSPYGQFDYYKPVHTIHTNFKRKDCGRFLPVSFFSQQCEVYFICTFYYLFSFYLCVNYPFLPSLLLCVCTTLLKNLKLNSGKKK